MNGHIANLFVFLTCEGQSNDCMIWSEALLLAEVRGNSSGAGIKWKRKHKNNS